jgi:hypothetical protein
MKKIGRKLEKMPPRGREPKGRKLIPMPRKRGRSLNAKDQARNSKRGPATGGLFYPTTHLKNVNRLEREMGLYGHVYRLIIKSIWYITVGQLIKDKIVRLGNVRTDCRNSFAYALPSGWGKKHIENILRKICNKLGESFSAVTSFHPEALLGKVLKPAKKGEPYKSIRGFLDDDMVLFNDAIELVRGKDFLYRESQKYLCTALDPIGDNMITKGGVEIPKEKRLRYFPKCTVIFHFQPFSLGEEVLLGGLFRRLPTIYLPFSERDRDEFSRKTSGHNNEDQSLPSFSRYLKHLKDKNLDVPSIIDDQVKKRFDQLHLMLLDYGKSFGSKSANFTNMIDFNLQNWLLKMSTVLAYSRRKTEVGLFDVEMAWCDLLEFWHSTLNFIEKKLTGSLDYGDTWHGATGKDQEMLKWLHEEGAVSEESSKISIKDYETKISTVFGTKEDSARGTYRRHKKAGWVSGKQISSHVSVVYLAFTPSLTGVGGKGGWVVKEYMEILTKYSPNPSFPKSSSKSIDSDTNILEESSSDDNKLEEKEKKLVISDLSNEKPFPPLDTTLPPTPPTREIPSETGIEDEINPFSLVVKDENEKS